MNLADDCETLLRNLIAHGPADACALASDLDWSWRWTTDVLHHLENAGRVRRRAARLAGRPTATLFHAVVADEFFPPTNEGLIRCSCSSGKKASGSK